MELIDYTLEQLYALRDFLIMTTEDKKSKEFKDKLEEINNIIFKKQ